VKFSIFSFGKTALLTDKIDNDYSEFHILSTNHCSASLPVGRMQTHMPRIGTSAKGSTESPNTESPGGSGRSGRVVPAGRS